MQQQKQKLCISEGVTMKSELITKLNTEISVISPETIRQHEASGDLDEWIYDWRMEIAATSCGLYLLLYEMARLLDLETGK